ncbi:hypothetical protein BKI52_23065 [marine bacterium AO1-C]|nr:hypothetical protein BKI52_23065 [marine bacterium AO1-C]
MSTQTITFWDAIRNGNLEVIKGYLTRHPQAINQKNERGFTPLILAAYYNQIDVLDHFISLGADIHTPDAIGNTALMGASFKGYIAIIEKLIKLGADVNVRNNQGATALIYASTFNKPEIARLLLANGADTTIKDGEGKTAQDHAKAQGLTWAEELFVS